VSRGGGTSAREVVGAAHGSHHPDPVPEQVDEEMTGSDSARVVGATQNRTDGIAISRRESAANLGARLPYSDRPVCAWRQTRARAAQAAEFWCPGSGAGARGPEEAVTLGVLMNKFVALPHEDAAALFGEPWSIDVRASPPYSGRVQEPAGSQDWALRLKFGLLSGRVEPCSAANHFAKLRPNAVGCFG
jgi:hypothetical protein